MKSWRKSILFLSGIIALIALTGCVGAGTTGWAGAAIEGNSLFISYGSVYALDGATGKEIWRFPSPANNSIAIYTPAAITPDLVVVGGFNHVLYGINPDNGSEKWAFTGAKDQYIGGILNSGTNYYAPNNDWHIYAVDNNGSLLWKFSAKAANWSKPVSDGNFVFLASMDHNLYALKTEYSQNELAVEKDGLKTVVSTPVWSAALGGAAVMEPVLENGVLYVGTLAGTVKAINSTNGAEIWTYGDSGSIASIWSKPAVKDGILFFADEKGKIYALDAMSGKPVWDTPYSSENVIIAGAAVTPDGIVFSTKTGKSILINASKQVKELITMQGAIYSTPIFSADRLILIPVNNQYLAAAIKLDGTQLWNFVPVKD